MLRDSERTSKRLLRRLFRRQPSPASACRSCCPGGPGHCPTEQSSLSRQAGALALDSLHVRTAASHKPFGCSAGTSPERLSLLLLETGQS